MHVSKGTASQAEETVSANIEARSWQLPGITSRAVCLWKSE